MKAGGIGKGIVLKDRREGEVMMGRNNEKGRECCEGRFRSKGNVVK